MWIDENTDFTDGEYNNKFFTVTVNVYANASIIEVQEAIKLVDAVLTNNTLVTSTPNLTAISEETNENGLYLSVDTNSDILKPAVDTWYTNFLSSHSDKIATGDYL